MIRRATVADIPQILEFGRAFHAFSPWKNIPIDEPALEAMLRKVMEDGAIFMAENGMCGGVMNPLYINPAYLAAVEMCWWAPKDGAALRKAFEEWAVEHGASFIQFSALANERMGLVGKMYHRAGYDFVEGIFFKRVA